LVIRAEKVFTLQKTGVELTVDLTVKGWKSVGIINVAKSRCP
jgi:hypothetical protein